MPIEIEGPKDGFTLTLHVYLTMTSNIKNKLIL